MKTSASQFEKIVEFMECHGDLNKPSFGPEGRLRAGQLWDELTHILNIDVTGDSRSREKWKKVWSDFKMNSKKKASKIHRSAFGTGGGPACRLVLSDLEQRVLNIIGSQAVTGLIDVQEAGLQLPVVAENDAQSVPVQVESSLLTQSQETIAETLSASPTEPIDVSPRASARPMGQSPQLGRLLREPSNGDIPTPRNNNPRRQRLTHSLRERSTPQRRRFGHSSQEQVSERFEMMDQMWRQIAQDFATENLRLRARELELQAQWQNLINQCLQVLQNVSNRFLDIVQEFLIR